MRAGGGAVVYVADSSNHRVKKFGAPCPGDVDGDQMVGINDFLLLLLAWGPNPGHPADLDGDGVVGINDLLALLADWGPCP